MLFCFFIFSDYTLLRNAIFIFCVIMNQKKALLIQILNKLKPHRELADGILALIESWYANDKAVDGLIHVISNSIRTLKDGEQKTVLQKWLEMVQKIKDMEENEKMSEEELDKLLADI